MSGAPGRNIVLIGMPGAGKSTVGPLLSKRLDMEYADTDDIIRAGQGKELRDIVRDHGFQYFLGVQERTIAALTLSNHVLATGGSVVKSPLAMKHLKENGRVIYLEIDCDTFEQRLAPGRRLARGGEQSLREVYAERTPLYLQYADIVVKCGGRSVESVVAEILTKI
jgi:shikimate kinase